MRGSELKDLSTQGRPRGGGQGSCRRLAAKSDSLPQRRQKDLAPGAGAEVFANLAAEGTRQLVIEELGQPPEDLKTVGFRMPVRPPCRASSTCLGGFRHHAGTSPGPRERDAALDLG